MTLGFKRRLFTMTTRCKTRSSSNSKKIGEDNSERIPLDLIIEILMKLPVKSIARFRCVSKLCGSILGSPNFTESFFTKSSSHPKILFTCRKEGETFFFTSPQPKKSSTLAADFHIKFPMDGRFNICSPVRGLVCGLNQESSKGIVPLICNPSTGQSLTLPKVKTKSKEVVCYLGYDPIDKQFKVLCMPRLYEAASPAKEQQVLTLGTGKKLSWRMIKCDIPHDPIPWKHYVCINGVLFYLACVHGNEIGKGIYIQIVCFDIRSEKFKFIRKSQDVNMLFSQSSLVNYKGKLAIYTGIHLCLLEDADKHQWSSIYVLPPNLFRELYFVGIISTGEIVFSPISISDSFYLLYYDYGRNTTKKVEIQGLEAFKHCTVYTFLDHVEDVKLI